MKTLEANKHKQSGFTIIELVIVILVIGILSAVALPRMIDLSTQARKSVVLAVAGNLSTSIELLRSQWIAEGKGNTVTNFDGQEFYIGTTSTNGAVKNTGAISVTTFDVTECINLWEKLLRNPPKTLADSTCLASRTCKFEAKYVGDVCTYSDRDLNAIDYNVATGTITARASDSSKSLES